MTPDEAERLAYDEDRELRFVDVTPTGALHKAHRWLSGWPISMVRSAALRQEGRLKWVMYVWVDNTEDWSVDTRTAYIAKTDPWVLEQG